MWIFVILMTKSHMTVQNVVSSKILSAKKYNIGQNNVALKPLI